MSYYKSHWLNNDILGVLNSHDSWCTQSLNSLWHIGEAVVLLGNRLAENIPLPLTLKGRCHNRTPEVRPCCIMLITASVWRHNKTMYFFCILNICNPHCRGNQEIYSHVMYLFLTQIKDVFLGHEKVSSAKWRKSSWLCWTCGRSNGFKDVTLSQQAQVIIEEREIRTWAIYRGRQCFVSEIMIMSWKSLSTKPSEWELYLLCFGLPKHSRIIFFIFILWIIWSWL